MNLFSKKNIKLELNSGIGDSLNTLLIWNRIPAYCRVHGVKCFVTYGRRHDCKWEDHIRDLVNRTDCLEYVERGDFDGVDGEVVKPERMDWHEYGIEPLMVELRPEEEFALGIAKPNVALQLRGNDPRKFWEIGRIVELIERLKDRYQVWAYDRPEYVEANRKVLEDVGAVAFVGNLPRCYNLVQRCDILVAPDSWSKYVARASDRRQVLLCMKVTYLTQADMFKFCFNEIYGRPEVGVVGIKEDGVLVENINEIDVGKVVEVL